MDENRFIRKDEAVFLDGPWRLSSQPPVFRLWRTFPLPGERFSPFSQCVAEALKRHAGDAACLDSHGSKFIPSGCIDFQGKEVTAVRLAAGRLKSLRCPIRHQDSLAVIHNGFVIRSLQEASRESRQPWKQRGNLNLRLFLIKRSFRPSSGCFLLLTAWIHWWPGRRCQSCCPWLPRLFRFR